MPGRLTYNYNKYRVLRCDLRGFGKSPYPNGPFSYHADIAGLLNAMEIKSAWFVATSFGGRVAVDFCLGHPQLVRGLVLVSPLISGYELNYDKNMGQLYLYGEK